MNTRPVYQALKYYNDYRAIKRGINTESPKPIVRRVGRRIYGKATGRLARRLFG